MLTRFSHKFVKQHKKAPDKVKTIFNYKARLFKENKNNPILNNHVLSGKLRGCWSINITGDWRAVYSINGDIYNFEMIGTHSQLYG